MNENNPKNSLKLYGMDKYFDTLSNLNKHKKIPKVLMLSGEKGSGKFTLINHFLTYLHDLNNYDLKNKTINTATSFYKSNINNIFSNIIHLQGGSFKKIKIEELRELKSKLSKSSISNGKRFIILDDVETFNKNSLNALLKIIEEPSTNDYFILINNETKKIIETIKSRCFEIKIFLSRKQKNEIINNLIKIHNLESNFDFSLLNLTPGNFLIFNRIFKENELSLQANYIENFKKLVNSYQKNKDLNSINVILSLTDLYFYKSENSKQPIEKIVENKSFIIDNINKLISYNINPNNLINAVSSKLVNE